MLTFKHSRKLLVFLFLFILLLIDFFIIGRLDPVCRSGQGYGFGYPVSFKIQEIQQYKFGFPRVIYNFKNFFVFWRQPALGKHFSNLKEFLVLDVPPSSIFFNITHFFVFFIFALLLLKFFRLKIFTILIIGLFFSIFHEYVAEGICIDPSFNDLWVNILGLLVGLIIGIIFVKKK